jgi:hypothetical protein
MHFPLPGTSNRPGPDTSGECKCDKRGSGLLGGLALNIYFGYARAARNQHHFGNTYGLPDEWD